MIFRKQGHILVFILPMRDWNKEFFEEEEEDKKKSFYPTYEGLKQILEKRGSRKEKEFLSYLWGIETI